MTADDLVEKVARVLVSPKADPSDWRYWTDEARAAIAVLTPLLRNVALKEAAKEVASLRWQEVDPHDGKTLAAAVNAICAMIK